jgi:hypothetical protein
MPSNLRHNITCTHDERWKTEDSRWMMDQKRRKAKVLHFSQHQIDHQFIDRMVGGIPQAPFRE